MSVVSCVAYRDRIDRILSETRGVKAQYGVTDWEWSRLTEWKTRPWLTGRQVEIIDRIEKKVFSLQGDS